MGKKVFAFQLSSLKHFHFQLVIISIGFYMSGNIIRSAIHEWYTDPVITSLDSIATPIEFVQFPTVTVCNDKGNEVHDNWAFIESLLNFLHLVCDTPSGQIQHGEYCNGTDLLRHDFKYLFESIIEENKAWAFEEENFNQSLKTFANKSRPTGQWSKLLRRAVDVVESGEMALEEMMNLPLQFFNKYFQFDEVIFENMHASLHSFSLLLSTNLDV